MYIGNSTDIGTIGEAAVIAECEKRDLHVSVPFSDNLPYDMIIDANGKLFKAQVKTTKSVKSNGTIQFSIDRTNGFTGEHMPYTADEIDVMFLYCIENGFMAAIGPDMFAGKRSITFRQIPPQTNQKIGINMVDEYDIRNSENKLLPIL